MRAAKDKLPAAGSLDNNVTFNVTDLIADNVYEFRVAAENADTQTSEFSPPSQPISTKPPFSKCFTQFSTCILPQWPTICSLTKMAIWGVLPVQSFGVASVARD